MDGTDDGSCGMTVKRMGMLVVSVRKVKALTEDLDCDTGEGR